MSGEVAVLVVIVTVAIVAVMAAREVRKLDRHYTMKVRCYTCGIDLHVSSLEPHLGVMRHLETEMHEANARRKEET